MRARQLFRIRGVPEYWWIAEPERVAGLAIAWSLEASHNPVLLRWARHIYPLAASQREIIEGVTERQIEYLRRLSDICAVNNPWRAAELRSALEAGSVNPRDIKFELAKAIVRIYHSASSAERAAADFEKVFTKKEMPEDIKTHMIDASELTVVDLLVVTGLMKSRGEAKRKIREGILPYQ